MSEVAAGGDHTWVFEAIGTRWVLTTAHALSQTQRLRVARLIEDYDRTFSRFREDSVVTRMSHAAGTFELPECAGPLLETYRRLDELTCGAVSPLVGAALVHLGYGPDCRLRPLPGYLPAPVWEEVCSWDGRCLRTRIPLTLDIGAVGKGQLVDLVMAEVLAADVSPDRGGDAPPAQLMVDAGGDLAHTGPARRIGLEDPDDAGRVIGVVTSPAGALCASATNRRSWAPGVHHVLDARSGRPTTGVRATWAAAPSAMIADAAATALFFQGPTRVADTLGVDALVLHEDRGAAWTSSGIAQWEVFA
ncbi:MAG: FAD:protein FMN transferase [Actinomyces sp.]|nr:FAD:protein FMN transferase [Actinomyces sp.]